MVSPFIGTEIGEGQKKGLCRKSTGLLVQKQVKTKKKGLRRKISRFLVQIRLETKQKEKTRSLPQICGVMFSHHNMMPPQMVLPQNGVTRGELPPLLAKPLLDCSTTAKQKNSKILFHF